MIHRMAAAAIALAALAFLTPRDAHAAAFNCRYAALPAEVAICQNPTLSSLDEEMASQYYYVVNRAPGWAAVKIKSQQSRWLNRRNACGYDGGCLMNAYNNRIGQLGQWRYSLGI